MMVQFFFSFGLSVFLWFVFPALVIVGSSIACIVELRCLRQSRWFKKVAGQTGCPKGGTRAIAVNAQTQCRSQRKHSAPQDPTEHAVSCHILIQRKPALVRAQAPALKMIVEKM